VATKIKSADTTDAAPTPTVAGARPTKNVIPGATPLQADTDPTDWDPRLAPPGTPIAFPDPEEDYPTEGVPYPPPEPDVP